MCDASTNDIACFGFLPVFMLLLGVMPSNDTCFIMLLKVFVKCFVKLFFTQIMQKQKVFTDVLS